MAQKLETWLYLHELRDYWKVAPATIRRWGRDGLLPSMSSAGGRLFHKKDIAAFEDKWTTALLHAQVENEVQNIRKTQLELEFSTFLHICESPFGEDLPLRELGVFHRTKARVRRLPRA